MLIRQATIEDAQEIARLHIVSWQATYANELPSDFLAGLDLGARTARWRGQIEQGVQVLLAEEDGFLIGYVSCGPAQYGESLRPEEWQIYNLHVTPPRHGQGIGSVLFDRAVQLGRQSGATGLMLWVVRTNTNARAFYERKGMRHDGISQEGHFAPGAVLDEIRYKMTLGSTGRPARAGHEGGPEREA